MTKRILAERTSTEVAMPQGADAAAAILPYANKIGSNILELTQARDQMNMNNMLSDANTEMAQVTAKWQNENASNPFDLDAAEKLKQSYGEIYKKYGEKVSVTSRGDWNEAHNKLTNQYIQSNLRWGTGQAVKNAESSVNMSFQKGNNFAYDSGANGVDVGLVNGNYATRADMVRKSLSTIGQSDQQIDETLANHKSDYMKSYVTGAIFRDPERGVMLLKEEKIVSDIGSPEAIQSLTDYAKKRKAQINDDHSWQIDDTASSLVKTYILDPETSFAEGMARIEDQYLAGNLGKGEAMRDALHNNLKSEKSVEATTNKKAMTELLLQVSDAQAQVAGKVDDLDNENATEFLTRIAQIREKSINLNTQGVLWRGDLEKIETEINGTAAAKKALSKSTEVISNDGQGWFTFGYKEAYHGKEYFGSLPASERDGALRDYFYAVQIKQANGKTLNNADRKKIAANIRQERAGDFLSRVNANLEGDGKITAYKSLEEASAANLEVGTMFTVNGKPYRKKPKAK